jgi:ADP-ribose pyrophosphatase
MKAIEKISLWKGKFLETFLISYKDRKGTVREWEAVGRIDSKEVVVMVPLTGKDEVILIRQFRPALDSYVIELPAGLVEDNEEVISAARRELIEETGYDSEKLILLTGGVMSTGINMEKWRIVLAPDAKKASEEILNAHPSDENEDIEVIKVPLEDIYTSLEAFRENGDEIDLRIFGLIELARRELNL